MPLTYDEKLDLILSRLFAIEAKLTSCVPTPDVVPAPTGGLFDFVRPDPSEDGHGLGTPMTEADPAEAIARACGNVNWMGDAVLSPADRDARWALIERLKKADPAILPFYRMLDPGFCGLGLLTNAFEPHTSDPLSFGVTRAAREAFAGMTVEAWISTQLGIGGTPGIGG